MNLSRYPVVFEFLFVLSAFFTAFLTGHQVDQRTGSGWWGAAAATAAFAVGAGLLRRLLPRNRDPRAPAPPPAQPTALSTIASYLVLFWPGYFGGRLVDKRSGSVWWGVIVGSALVVGLAAIFVWADWRAKTRKLSPAAPVPAPDLPEEELCWAEPREFRSDDARETKRVTLILILCTAAAAAFFLWFVNRQGYQPVPTRKLLITAGGIIVLFLGLLGFTRLMRIIVRITEKGIVQDFGEPPVVYRYDTIASCEIGSTLVGSRVRGVLTVKLRNGDSEVFCVHPAISRERLRSALERRGVTVTARQDLLRKEEFERL